MPYANDYPLTKEIFNSRNGDFSGNIPEGWFVSPLDSLPASYKVWLISEDYAATLNVGELKLDRLTEEQVANSGMKLLAELSMAFHRETSSRGSIISQPREFKLGNLEVCGYERQYNASRERVVVFAIKNRYFESTATPLKGTWSAQNLSHLFSIQQTVLSSLVAR